MKFTPHTVIPAQAGIQYSLIRGELFARPKLGTGLRWRDGKLFGALR
jgi:hypothetical protein